MMMLIPRRWGVLFSAPRGEGSLRAVVALSAALVAGLLVAGRASGASSSWQPEAPKYGYGVTRNASVRMDDGVSLSADVYYPTDASGARASGKFPVLLEQSPYGKGRGEVETARQASYFVTRGYILAVTDLRGFGQSHGQAAWFGSRMGKDGAELADWAAHLEDSNGKVGLIGCSYLGVIQFFTANSLSSNSPVKAITPFCADSNFYRDLTAFGGIPTQFVAVDRAVTAPGVEDDPATDPFMQTIISEGSGENAYYNDYWKSLDVTTFMPKIVSLGIPVLSETGWYDLFPGGNIDAHIAAQNAWLHRPVDKPLKAGDRLSGKYQAIVGPWTHGEHTDGALQPVLLRWFDTWLKGEATGMADTNRPLHMFVIGADTWIDTASYPITDRAVTFNLSPGALSREGSPSSCEQKASEQKGSSESAAGDCSQMLMWVAEGEGTTLTFDSASLREPLIIGGPGDVTVYLKSSRPEVELTATLSDVAPDGHVTKITNGAQLGSQRALDESTSWYSRDGKLIRPSHYFTKDKSSPVPVGQTIRLDIELVPTLIRIPAGHKLRLQLVSLPATGFHQYGPRIQMRNPLVPTPEELKNLTGGIYTILYGSAAPSAINLSTASDADLAVSATDWGPKE